MDALKIYRQKYVWLNYMYGEQLQIMGRFLTYRTKENPDEVEAILKFINRDVSMHISRIDSLMIPKQTAHSVLDAIGRYLCSLFDDLEPIRRSFT